MRSRTALATEREVRKAAREQDGANVLTFGGGRHAKRVEKIDALDQRG